MQLDPVYRQKIRSLLDEKPQRNIYKRFTILTYQLGDVGKSMRYMDIYPEERAAQLAYFKTAIADLMVQTIIMAELFKLDLEEIIKLGIDRLDEFKLKSRYVEPE
jgi:hypothetical protein